MSSTDAADIAESLFKTIDHWGWEIAFERHHEPLSAQTPAARALRELVLGWLAVEHTHADEAENHFRHVYDDPQCGGLAHVGKALVSVRIKDFRTAEQALAAAARTAEGDARLTGAIAHVRGTKAAHEGDQASAKRHLFDAIATLGREHYAFGRALDTLGNLYANKDNFLVARLFFMQALECKTRVNDRRGRALTHGQLGRLYLDWGYLQLAEEQFREDLRLAEELGDTFGQARMYGSLGQVALLHAQERRLHGRDDLARDFCTRAHDWLTACIDTSRAHGFTISEGFARKDRAFVHMIEGELTKAELELAEARALFLAKHFHEGIAHTDRAAGVLARMQGDWATARQHLRTALSAFAQRDDRSEVAATRLELARVARLANEPATLVEQSLIEALRAAELTRRITLIRQVEQELREALPAVYWEQLFQRVRGQSIDDDATTLIDGMRESATVLYFDLQGSTDFAYGRDPEEVMMTINQMMAETALVLRRHKAQTVLFRGDGFQALCRGADHACRGVETGLDLVAAIDEFNEPRRVLGIPEFHCRIGISTGEVLLGNVGTYDKMDYSGIGTMMNLGARLEAKAEVGKPCISQTTYDMVRKRFVFAAGNPRTIDAKGVGQTQVWDVAGRVSDSKRA